jgi:hypothetical protein
MCRGDPVNNNVTTVVAIEPDLLWCRDYQMAKVKQARKYDINNDLRRALDGNRLHPLLSYALIDGAEALRERYPDCLITPRDFARSAISVLERAGVIARVDPDVEVPVWLEGRDKRFARGRGKRRPAWVITPRFPRDFKSGLCRFQLWSCFVADISGDEIIWTINKLPHKVH